MSLVLCLPHTLRIASPRATAVQAASNSVTHTVWQSEADQDTIHMLSFVLQSTFWWLCRGNYGIEGDIAGQHCALRTCCIVTLSSDTVVPCTRPWNFNVGSPTETLKMDMTSKCLGSRVAYYRITVHCYNTDNSQCIVGTDIICILISASGHLLSLCCWSLKSMCMNVCMCLDHFLVFWALHRWTVPLLSTSTMPFRHPTSSAFC